MSFKKPIAKANIFYSILLILILIGIISATTIISDTQISTPYMEILNPNQKGDFIISSNSNHHSELTLKDSGTEEIWAFSHRNSSGNNALQINFKNSSGTWLDLFLTILKTGNVGIGETNPESKLEVNGNVNLNNTLYITETNKVGIRTNDSQYMLDMGVNTYISFDGLFGHIIQHNDASSQFWTLAPRNSGTFSIATSTSDPRPGGNVISSSNDKLTITSDGSIIINTLEGSYSNGEAYICIYDNGTLFAKDSACS